MGRYVSTKIIINILTFVKTGEHELLRDAHVALRNTKMLEKTGDRRAWRMNHNTNCPCDTMHTSKLFTTEGSVDPRTMSFISHPKQKVWAKNAVPNGPRTGFSATASSSSQGHWPVRSRRAPLGLHHQTSGTDGNYDTSSPQRPWTPAPASGRGEGK